MLPLPSVIRNQVAGIPVVESVAENVKFTLEGTGRFWSSVPFA